MKTIEGEVRIQVDLTWRQYEAAVMLGIIEVPRVTFYAHNKDFKPTGILSLMPSTSKKQQRFMGADLARARAGQPTQTGMSESQLSDFASGPIKKKAPAKKKKK